MRRDLITVKEDHDRMADKLKFFTSESEVDLDEMEKALAHIRSTKAKAAAGNLEAGLLRRALRDMAPCLRGLPQRMGLLGVDADLVARLRPGILKLADQLERLHG